MALSLKGLQAFESAARTGSFAAAAVELSVTPAAVSQLIRGLEESLGRELFYRVNRGIFPTEAALEVMPQLRASFEQLNAVSTQLSGHGRRSRLTISMPPSLITGWLCSEIGTFVKNEEPFSLSIRGEEDPVDFERDNIDFRLSFGRFHYRSFDTVPLLTDALYPVCSPQLFTQYKDAAKALNLLKMPLIQTDWGPSAATFPSWTSWFEATGTSPPADDYNNTLIANSSKAALDLAVSGLGVSLCQGLLAAGQIERGTLVLASRSHMPLSQPYCVTIPEHSSKRLLVSRFNEWFSKNCSLAANYTKDASLLA